MKKFLALLLAFTMVFAVAVTASADDAKAPEDYSGTLTSTLPMMPIL